MTDSDKGVLLVVDDEPLKRITLQIELSQAGYTVLDAPDATSAIHVLQDRPVNVVITDLRMPQMDGLQFLERIKTRWPQTHVILMTAYGSVDSAVAAIKHGAFDYLTKPFRTETLLEKLDRLRSAYAWNRDGQQDKAIPDHIGSFVGQSHAARRLLQQIQAVADSDQILLIEGESGTGKSRVAEAIHQLSRRANRPMVTFNCTAVPPATVDSTLFARFQTASGSTLLIEEVDALPVETQRALLHVMEHGQIQTADPAQPHPVDVRLICTANKSLRPLIEAGQFREDLYYRLSAVSLSVPPLRERRGDIPILARNFLRRYSDRASGRPVPSEISPHAIEAMLGYHWPGNVRELEHVLERALTVAAGPQIELKDMLLPQEPASPAIPATTLANGMAGLTETIAGIERTLIDSALQRAAGNQARAAQYLGIPRTTLRDKMAKYGMGSQFAKP